MSGLRLYELEQRRLDAIGEAVMIACGAVVVIVLYLVGAL